jgi:hypothetical protein
MTKRKLFIFPVFFILLISVQAVRVFYASPSPYSFTGIDAVIPRLIPIAAIFYFAFIVKERYWRFGMILIGLAFIARSCISGYPEQKLNFLISTLALNFLSTVTLYASWRALGTGFTLESQAQRNENYSPKAIFVGLVILVIAGIFLFWSKG